MYLLPFFHSEALPTYHDTNIVSKLTSCSVRFNLVTDQSLKAVARRILSDSTSTM